MVHEDLRASEASERITLLSRRTMYAGNADFRSVISVERLFLGLGA